MRLTTTTTPCVHFNFINLWRIRYNEIAQRELLIQELERNNHNKRRGAGAGPGAHAQPGGAAGATSGQQARAVGCGRTVAGAD